MQLLELKEISKYYLQGRGFLGQKQEVIKAVDKVSLSLNQGEGLGLVGESGCGKSTLAKLLLRLERPDRGKIIFRGQDIRENSRKQMQDYRREVQMVFQDSFSSFNPRCPKAQEVCHIHQPALRGQGEHWIACPVD